MMENEVRRGRESKRWNWDAGGCRCHHRLWGPLPLLEIPPLAPWHRSLFVLLLPVWVMPSWWNSPAWGSSYNRNHKRTPDWLKSKIWWGIDLKVQTVATLWHSAPFTWTAVTKGASVLWKNFEIQANDVNLTTVWYAYGSYRVTSATSQWHHKVAAVVYESHLHRSLILYLSTNFGHQFIRSEK